MPGTVHRCRMWVSDKTITRIAQALNTEIFQLFVPYNAHKRELNVSSASVLLELRQNILSDVEKLNAHIDYRFNEAFKSPMHHHNGKEPETPKPVRKR